MAAFRERKKRALVEMSWSKGAQLNRQPHRHVRRKQSLCVWVPIDHLNTSNTHKQLNVPALPRFREPAAVRGPGGLDHPDRHSCVHNQAHKNHPRGSSLGPGSHKTYAKHRPARVHNQTVRRPWRAVRRIKRTWPKAHQANNRATCHWFPGSTDKRKAGQHNATKAEQPSPGPYKRKEPSVWRLATFASGGPHIRPIQTQHSPADALRGTTISTARHARNVNQDRRVLGCKPVLSISAASTHPQTPVSKPGAGIGVGPVLTSIVIVPSLRSNPSSATRCKAEAGTRHAARPREGLPPGGIGSDDMS